MSPRFHTNAYMKNRRHVLRLLVAASCGLSALGCAGPLIRGQSPESEKYIDEEVQKRVKLIGDMTVMWGFDYQKVESVALVTGLANTGSDPPPSAQRQILLSEMQSHEVDNPNQVLASLETAMVVTRGYIPPGAVKGDRFDIEVRVAPRTDTTSLRGGWLMQTRLRETEMLKDRKVHTGHVSAYAAGPVVVDAVFQGDADPVLETRGRVQNGGVVSKNRLMGLVLTGEHSVKTSAKIGRAIDQRFHMMEHGVKVGVANPKDDDYIELKMYPRYKHNIARYLRVVRNIAFNESTTDRAQRLMMLDRQVLDPSTVATAALQLEAIGKTDGIPILKKGLLSHDPEVRFYCAEALVYLDEREGATALKEAAEREPAFRWHALTALASMDHLDALAALDELLNVSSAETRYGAFRAMKIRNSQDPKVKGQTFNQEFSLHAVPSSAEPMVHFTQSSQPEIVVFGDQLEILPPDFTFAGKHIIIKRVGPQELRVSCFQPGQENDKVEICSTRLTDCIATVARLGGHYEDMLHLVHEAKKQNYIAARVVVDALPQSSRLLEKQFEELAQNDVSRRRKIAMPLPSMFDNPLAHDRNKHADDEAALGAAAAEAAREAVQEQEASKKKGVWNKMMWWK
jgi:HEAT repeat protein